MSVWMAVTELVEDVVPEYKTIKLQPTAKAQDDVFFNDALHNCVTVKCPLTNEVSQGKPRTPFMPLERWEGRERRRIKWKLLSCGSFYKKEPERGACRSFGFCNRSLAIIP